MKIVDSLFGSVSQKSFFSRLQEILSDIIFMYRSFFHWNLSKILIECISFFAALALSFPFFVLIALLMSLDSIPWKELILGVFQGKAIGYEVIAGALSSPFLLFIEALFFVFLLLALILGYNYSLFLKANLYLGYHRKERIKIFSKILFDRQSFIGFIRIFLRNLSFFLIPLLLFLVLGLASFFFYVAKMINFSTFSYFLLTFLTFSLVFLFYIAFRIGFSYIEFAIDPTLSSKAALYESTRKTQKLRTLFSFLTLFALFIFLMIPLQIPGWILSTNEKEKMDYLYSISETADISTEEKAYYQYLQEKYRAVPAQVIGKDVKHIRILGFLWSICIFLCVEGLFFQGMVSFYMNFCQEQEKNRRSLFFKKILGKF